MKKIFAGIVLPTLAAAAVIGSGFSIWFFGENQTKISEESAVKVENLLKIGDLESKTVGEMHLDQTADVRKYILDNNVNTTPTSGKKNYDATKFGAYSTKIKADGIFMEMGASANGTIKYTAPSGLDNHLQDKLDTICKVEIKTTFTFGGDLKNYVGMNAADTTKWVKDVGAGIYTYTWTDTDIQHGVKLPLNDGTASTFSFVYVDVTAAAHPYKTTTGHDVKRDDATYDAETAMKTAEPHNEAEYAAMYAAVKDCKLTIETVATIVEA